jgi:hypothetical protein
MGPTVFTKNRQRLIEHDAVVMFFNEVLKQAPESVVRPSGRSRIQARITQEHQEIYYAHPQMRIIIPTIGRYRP